jgi:hypothetical protein
MMDIEKQVTYGPKSALEDWEVAQDLAPRTDRRLEPIKDKTQAVREILLCSLLITKGKPLTYRSSIAI